MAAKGAERENPVARTANTKLDTRGARARLKVRAKPYNLTIGPKRMLGYIRAALGAGRWLALVEIGRGPTGSALRRQGDLGLADDLAPADGAGILSYGQALAAAAAWLPEDGPRSGKIKVREAITSHVKAKRASDGDAAATDKGGRLRLHVLREDEDGKPLPGPRGLGDREVASLTLTELRAWRDALVEGRSRKTVNRIIADFKAALNHAYADPKAGIPSDSAWRKLKGFSRKQLGDEAGGREDHFSEAEALAAIEAAREIDPAFGDLCEATFHTGARAPGELAALDVRHFNAQRATIAIPDGKTGPRITTLTSEGVAFFKRVAHGKALRDILLPRADGERWLKSNQQQPMKKALRAARLSKSASMYTFRHTYISRAIERGMPLPLIAENVGTSVRMIEVVYFHMFAEKRREMVERTAPRLRVVVGAKEAA
jgi:integrase